MPDQKGIIFPVNKRMDRNLNPIKNIVRRSCPNKVISTFKNKNYFKNSYSNISIGYAYKDFE